MDGQARRFTGWVSRLLMLVALVLGVAAMHTLGHLDHHQGYGATPGHEGAHAPPAPPPTVAVDVGVDVGAGAGAGAGAGVGQEASGLGGTLPRLDPASVCLAVLPSLLLLLMAAVLLRARHRRNTGAIGARPGARGARSPPRRTAVRLARLSVLRI
ncbi:DUF6153 family protein [Planobispora siamensis]|uniref:Uncharacterized protein n=1 Tax=Planobispora siamensis TaxID=936338 RepID=A0A8J3SLR1_9ACTN|nr:DUF6153 family protein [Planobispora siamensis]GIH95187.1 hypothetical protein Psi01_58170 [Planobispora siamensis]